MFEQAFKNIDDVLRKDAGCTSELDYTEQSSWLLFLKYLDGLEQDKADEAALEGKKYKYILEKPYRWESWAAPKGKDGKIDHNATMTGDDLLGFVNQKLFPFLHDFKSKATGPNTIEYKNQDGMGDLIRNWLRNRNTLEFLGLWEQLNNPSFNPVEFDGIKSQAGLNSYTLTPKQWIEKTDAIGLISKAGRYGGTYAHKDIAFEFASWISVEFKLYLIKEFQRLKEHEQKTLGWDIRRNLTKINYRIHTDAIQAHLIPQSLTKSQAALVYASEADVLNMALFGKTAMQWRTENPKSKGNIRDEANAAQLVCLSNLENLHALFIAEQVRQSDRLLRLNKMAIAQMKLLTTDSRLPRLPRGEKS